MKRRLALGLILVGLAGCDDADPCFVTPDGDIVALLRSPSMGDTLRIGEPFRFRAEFEGEGNVTAAGVVLEWGPPGGSFPERDSVLFERPLRSGAGRYVVDEDVTIRELPGGASASDLGARGVFNVGAYGKVGFAGCEGVGGSRSATFARVTVLD